MSRDPRSRKDRRTTLLALDGNSLAHRAYHAYGASRMTDESGRPIWAVYGFLTLLAGVCDKISPDAVIVGFDGDDNVRKQRYPDYKATRSEKPKELTDQLAAIPTLLTRMGVAVDHPRGWEADDVVASWAAAAEAGGWQTIVATSDRDAFSLITDRCAVMRLKNGLDNAVFYTPERLRSEYGITPEQYIDFSALRGDTSDNLPGIDGIGEKTAAKLLQAFPGVVEALAAPGAAKAAIGDAGARRLQDGQANWKRNIELMAQRRDLPVELDRSRLSNLDEAQALDALRAAGLGSLAGRVGTHLLAAAQAPRTAARPKGEVVTASETPPVPAPSPPEAAAPSVRTRRTDPRLAPASAIHRRPAEWPLTV